MYHIQYFTVNLQVSVGVYVETEHVAELCIWISNEHVCVNDTAMGAWQKVTGPSGLMLLKIH